MNNKQKGELGESIARKYITKSGGYIIDTNYRIRSGEIDIISRFGEEIVFVEVKSRSNINYGYPAESVNYNKMKKIKNTANHYILKNNLYKYQVRFDVIEVYLNNMEVNHIVNAF